MNVYGNEVSTHNRNSHTATTYTPAQQIQSRRVLDVLELGYNYESSHVTYRKKHISLKILNLRVRDKILAKQAMQCVTDNGYKVETEDKATIISIPR